MPNGTCTHTHTVRMILGGGRKPENLEETHADPLTLVGDWIKENGAIARQHYLLCLTFQHASSYQLSVILTPPQHSLWLLYTWQKSQCKPDKQTCPESSSFSTFWMFAGIMLSASTLTKHCSYTIWIKSTDSWAIQTSASFFLTPCWAIWLTLIPAPPAGGWVVWRCYTLYQKLASQLASYIIQNTADKLFALISYCVLGDGDQCDVSAENGQSSGGWSHSWHEGSWGHHRVH